MRDRRLINIVNEVAEDYPLFLDAVAKGGQRLTSFGRTVSDVIADFRVWVETNELEGEDITYSDIFEIRDYLPDKVDPPVCVAQCKLLEDGRVMLNRPASPINPFVRKETGIFARIICKIKRL